MALSRKKKNNLMLLVMLALIIVAGIVYLVVLQKKTDEPADPTPGGSHSLVLSDIASADIAKVTLVNANFNGTIVRTFVETDGKKTAKYELEGKADFPLDQRKAELIFTNVSLEAKEFLTENGDAAEYGLTKPLIKAEIVSTSGKTAVLSIGDAVGMVERGGFYANVNGGSDIYIAKTDMKTVLSYGESDLIEVGIPTLDTARTESVTIASTVGGITSTVRFIHDTEAVKAIYGAAYQNWFLEDTSGRRLLADNELASQYVSDNFKKIGVSKAVDYKAENQSKYGFDTNSLKAVIKLAVEDADGNKIGSEEYTLFVGNKYSDSEYYVMFEGDVRTYIMYESQVKSIFEVTISNFLDKYFCVMNMATVSTVTTTTNGETNRFDISHKTETDADDKEKTTITGVKKNGEELEAMTLFTGFYTNLALQTWNKVVENTVLENADALLTIEYERTSEQYQKLTFSFVPYNDNYVLVCLNGIKMYTISKTALDGIIRLIP